MSMTFSQLQAMVHAAGIITTAAPADRLLANLDTPSGSVHLVIWLSNGGRVLQFRTVGLLSAPKGARRAALLKAILDANHRLKLVKFALDAGDGEIVAYVDIVLGDAKLLGRLLERVEHSGVRSQLGEECRHAAGQGAR